MSITLTDSWQLSTTMTDSWQLSITLIDSWQLSIIMTDSWQMSIILTDSWQTSVTLTDSQQMCIHHSQSVETATWCKTFKLQLRQLATLHTLKMTAGACASEHAVTQLRFCCMSWTRLWHLMTLAFRRWIYILLFTYLLHVKITIFRFNCSSQPQL